MIISRKLRTQLSPLLSCLGVKTNGVENWLNEYYGRLGRLNKSDKMHFQLLYNSYNDECQNSLHFHSKATCTLYDFLDIYKWIIEVFLPIFSVNNNINHIGVSWQYLYASKQCSARQSCHLYWHVYLIFWTLTLI